MLPFADPDRSAVLSPCSRYRYRLDRTWDRGGRRCAWVMLNPSTADATEDDPTLRRVIGFSQRWGFGSLVVVNLFAYRTTDPKNLPVDDAAIGLDCDAHIRAALTESHRVICGWGQSVDPSRRRPRERFVASLAAELGLTLECLGTTTGGAPRHPLYIASNTPPVGWAPDS